MHVGIIGLGKMGGNMRERLQAWRVVQPVIDDPPRVELYERGAWGPRSAGEVAHAVGGWDDVEGG